MTARKVRNQNSRRVRVDHGVPSLVVLNFKPEPVVEENPKSGVKFIWRDGSIIKVK